MSLLTATVRGQDRVEVGEKHREIVKNLLLKDLLCLEALQSPVYRGGEHSGLWCTESFWGLGLLSFQKVLTL